MPSRTGFLIHMNASYKKSKAICEIKEVELNIRLKFIQI